MSGNVKSMVIGMFIFGLVILWALQWGPLEPSLSTPRPVPSAVLLSEHRITQLRHALNRYIADHAEIPNGDGSEILRALLEYDKDGVLHDDEWIIDGVALDSWGREIRIEPLSTRTYLLSSAGIDGVRGTADDIVFSETGRAKWGRKR